jgi:hypothetical protein
MLHRLVEDTHHILKKDLQLESYLHTDTMVIRANIAG